MFVKICGVTSAADAELAVRAGADAVGINLVPSSKRVVTEDVAREIARTVADRVKVVAVVADRSADELRILRERTGIRHLQLHGHEAREMLEALLPDAYKAVRIGSADDAARATDWPGSVLLVDASVPGALGGTGATFDWTWVRDLCRARRVVLAGGLTVENVGDAIAIARPWGVDVASGVDVEGSPRRKDDEKVRAFVARAKSLMSS